MKKERPILFSTPMVQALLAGRKTQTRRIVKWRPLQWLTENNFSPDQVSACNMPDNKRPYGKTGDLLWVRETVANLNADFPNISPHFIYKADIENHNQHGPVSWKPSIHMPKSACRIWLEVENVRIERLHDISPNDAGSEGMEYWNVDWESFEGGELVADYPNYEWRDDPEYELHNFPTFANPVDSFFSLWRKINGKESFESNPWVWVVEFKVLSTTGKPTENPTYNFHQEINNQTSHW